MTISLGTLVLIVAFGFLIAALGFVWSALTNFSEMDDITVDEALEYAALTHDEERKVAVLRSLKDLEYEHALRKISDEDYETLSRRYRQEARSLLERLDDADAALKKSVLQIVEKRMGEKP